MASYPAVQRHGDHTVISIRIERQMLERLRALASAEHRSVSQQVRYILEQWLAGPREREA